MNLETFFKGTRKEMQEDIESKIIIGERTNYPFKWYCNFLMEYAAAGVLLYGGKEIGLPQEVTTLGSCVILLDVLQRVATMGVGVVKYHTRKNKVSVGERDLQKDQKEFLKYILATPSFIGWYRTIKQYVNRR